MGGWQNPEVVWPDVRSSDLALRVAVAEATWRRSDQLICIVVEDARGEVCAGRCLCQPFERQLSERSHAKLPKN